MWLVLEDIDTDKAAEVAKASTISMVNAGLISVVPIIEFGILVALALFLVKIPLKWGERHG